MALIVLAIFILLLFFGTFIDSVKARIAELEDQITRDLRLLKLTMKRQEELAKKVVQVYRIVVSITFFVFVSSIVLAVLAGTAYQDVLEIHLGSAGILVAMITVIFYNTWNPDVMLTVLKERIRVWIYRRNGFNVSDIENVETRLKTNKILLNNILVDTSNSN